MPGTERNGGFHDRPTLVSRRKGRAPVAGAASLEKSRTFENLRKALADEASLAYRFRYYATLADFEGMDPLSALFQEIAEGGTCSVQGCFDFLTLARDPDSGLRVGRTLKNLESLLQIETKQHGRTYPEMARTARREGFPDIASWFETLQKLKRSHIRKLRKLAHD